MGKEVKMKKDWIARELTMEVIVGVFVVMILLGLAYFTFILKGKMWGEQEYTMEVIFDEVMGLRVRDSVVCRGMPVGEVKRLELDKDGHGVRVHLTLNKQLHMRNEYKIMVISTSILGGRNLQIYEGPAANKKLDLDVYHGEKPHDLMADAADLVNAVKDGFISEDGVIANLQEATAQIRDITTRLNRGEGTLGRLLSEDDKLYNDLSSTMASLKDLSGRLEKGEGTLGRLMSSDDKLYKDLSDAVASLKNITERIQRGEGVLGRLLQDDSLYEEIKETVNEVRAAVDDFRETSPIVTFTSIFFGAF